MPQRILCTDVASAFYRSREKIDFRLRKRHFRPSAEQKAWSACTLYFTPNASLDLLLLQAMAANSLLSITHSLKLMFLLGDEQYITQRREERLRGAITDISAAKSRVEKAWDGLREPRVFNAEEYAKENPVQGDT